MKHDDYPLIFFPTKSEFESWLVQNYDKASGIWIKFAKVASGIPSLLYQEALEVALCYGWIDGQRNTIDAQFHKTKFTPRGPHSLWSKRNVGIVIELIKQGRMKPSGLAEIEKAKADGRWDNAYDSPANMEIPEDFLKELAKDKQAQEFFLTLNKTNTYALAWRLQTAKKPETRQRRMQQLLEMLKRGERLY